MRKRTWLAAARGSLLAASLSLSGAAASASASTVSPVVGYTYIDGNTATANTIDGFARHADGSLTAMAGSPFAAGGAGLASQGAIQVTPDGRYLLVDGSAMHFVSVFAVNGGNLTEVPSSPTPLPAGATSSSGIVNT